MEWMHCIDSPQRAERAGRGKTETKKMEKYERIAQQNKLLWRTSVREVQ